MNRNVEWLARELETIKKSVRDKGSTPQLGTSSMEGGQLLVNDGAGELKQVVGEQVDGTNTTIQVNGPVPPKPSAPGTEPMQGSVRVLWDGTWADGAMAPLDLARLDVHFTDAPDADPLLHSPQASILSQGWGDVAMPLIPGTYYVALVAWTTSGKYSISDFSPPFVVDPISVDLSALEDALDALDEALEAAQLEIDGILPITETKIADDAITTPKIAAGAVTAEQILARTITALQIEAETITSNEILARTITALQIEVGTITANEILAGTITANEILAGTITANEVSSDIVVVNDVYATDGIHIRGDSGASLDLTTVNGYQQSDSNGDLRISFPIDSDATSPYVFDGEMVARAITVINQFALRGLNNEVATGARLTLQSGVTAPTASPTVTVDWENKPIAGSYVPYGFAKFNGYYWSTESLYSGGAIAFYDDGVDFKRPFTPDGVFGPGGSVNGAFGVAFIGSSGYVLCWSKDNIPGTYFSDYYVYKYDWSGTAWTFDTRWRYRPSGTTLGGYSPKQPALGVKGGNLIIAQCSTTGAAWVHEFTTAGAQVASATLKTSPGVDWAPNAHFRTIEYGNFDYGSPRYVTVRADVAFADTWNASMLSTTADSFQLPTTAVVGLLWDSSAGRFRSRSATTVYEHTTANWNTGTSADPWLAASSWYDPNATGGTHETQAGTPVVFSMKKRARAVISAPPIPARPIPNTTDDVTSVRIYIARTDPLKLDRLATPAPGVRTATITTTPAFPTTPVNPPPSSNNFPAAAPAEFVSAAQILGLPAWSLRGDGSATARDPLMPTDISNKRYVDDKVGSRITYTPTLGGAAGSATASYIKVGDEVRVTFLITLSGAASGTITLSKPINSLDTGASIALGQAMALDASSSPVSTSRRSLTVVNTGATNVFFIVDSATTAATVAVGAPWTWASGDTIGGTFTYQVA